MARKKNLVFYSYDGRIERRDHIWVKDALTATVAMFRRLGIYTNLENTKALVYTPIYIWDNWSEAAYNRRSTR